MCDMRRRGEGSFDIRQRTWAIKGKGIKKSIKQLSEILKDDVPDSEKGSLPFWRKYLGMLAEQDNAYKRQASPLQIRLWSIDRLISVYRSQGLDTAILDQERQRCLDVPAHDIDNVDTVMIDPRMKKLCADLEIGHDDYEKIGKLAKVALPKVKIQDTLQSEINAYLKSMKSSGAYNELKIALDMLTGATGQIAFRELTVTHWRAFNVLMNAQDVGERTKYNRQSLGLRFLRRLRDNYDLPMGFLNKPEGILECPDGDKIQYSEQQLAIALKEATGIDRFSLLMGLNCGFYWGDLAELTQDMIQEGHVCKVRAKESHKKNAMCGQWLLWPETQEAIQYGLNEKTLQASFSKFAKKHGLESHKALRKTIAQWLDDKELESEARLYRGERSGDNHGKYYIKLTPAQIAKLDSALLKVRDWLKTLCDF